MGLLDDGFDNFNTDEKKVQDSKQDCKVELKVSGPNINKTYTGKTGRDHGHAEMDALDKFIVELQTKHVYKAIDKRVNEDLIGVDRNELTGTDKDEIDVGTAANGEYVAKSTVPFFEDHTITLTCKEKSCCKKCSSVLGNLDISAGDDTYKYNGKMEQTEYGCTNKVKDFIKAYLESRENSEKEIKAYIVELSK